MNGFAAALWSEALKARRSRAPWASALGLALGPLVGGLFMLILKDPTWARRFGLITAKAQLMAGTADWPTYVALLAQMVAVGGTVVFGLVAVWIFGREYGDRTVTGLLALPTARVTIVAAKFVVVALWSAALAVLVAGLGLVVGAAIGLPGWSSGLVPHAVARLALTAALAIALIPPVALAASAGRGYLPPIGVMFLAIFLAQVVAALGWGAYFPWSVPALAAGVAGPGLRDLGPESYLLVALTGLAGIGGTAAWWCLADQV